MEGVGAMGIEKLSWFAGAGGDTGQDTGIMGGGRKEESRAASFCDLHIMNTKMNEKRVLGQCDATFSGFSVAVEPLPPFLVPRLR